MKNHIQHTTIVPDLWLGNCLGCSAYRLNADDYLSSESKIENMRKSLKLWLENKENIFVHSKVNVTNLALAHCLEDLGFRIIDTNVVFRCPHPTFLYSAFDSDINTIVIRQAIPDDCQAVVDIARHSFSYTRFHLDPKIKPEIANLIKASWVQNYFLGKRGDGLLVALVDQEIAGFLLYLFILEQQELVIDLITVAKKYRGKGLATKMIRHLASNNNCQSIKVGTQVANIPSIRLYEKLGFCLCESYYVFHYHGNKANIPYDN